MMRRPQSAECKAQSAECKVQSAKRKLRKASRPAWACGLVLLAVGLLPAARHNPNPGFEFGVNPSYDDNVFQYSVRDESLFVYRAAPQRFPFRSLDDVVLNVSGRLSWQPRVIHRHTTQLGLGLVAHEFLSNPVKNYLSASVRARQYFTRGLYVEGSYLLIPGYLIRFYRVPGSTSDYQPCTFTEHLVSLQAGGRWTGWLDAAPFIRYEIDDYQEPFAFYRTAALRAGAGATFQVLSWLGLGLNYEFKAANSQHVAPDISYLQHEGEAVLKPKLGRFGLDIGYDYAGRGYTASAQVDTTHAERIDATTGVFGRLSCALAQGFSLTADVRREARNSSSPYKADIDDVKDYTQWKAGLGVRWGR